MNKQKEVKMEQPKSENINKGNGIVQDYKNKIRNSEEDLERLSQNAGEKVGAMASDFANATTGYIKTGRQFVQENPATSVAIAAATGLILGGLLTASLRRK